MLDEEVSAFQIMEDYLQRLKTPAQFALLVNDEEYVAANKDVNDFTLAYLFKSNREKIYKTEQGKIICDRYANAIQNTVLRIEEEQSKLSETNSTQALEIERLKKELEEAKGNKL